MTTQTKLSSSPAEGSTVRIAAIDILRAITMVLMIWVNDFWSLKDIPEWLEHVERGVDGIGFSDVIFPAFLFIVGLSLPYAIENRRKKGDNNLQLLGHAALRTIGLLVMGVFLVNGESFNGEATGFPRWVWNPLSCLCFILIWNSYPKTFNKTVANALKILAIAILIYMAYRYRGGEDGTEMMKPKWWGILGLIGWAYLASAVVTVFARDRFWVIYMGWLFFCLLSMAAKAQMVPYLGIPDAISGGTLTGLTMGGVLSSYIFRHYVKTGEAMKLTSVFLGMSGILIALSIATRPYWKLAKLGATPAWLFLCSAFTLLAFTLVYWIADRWRKSEWFAFIKPAGTDTLLCYLMPYFLYMIFRFTGLNKLPEAMITGGAGLLKSFIFALICVQVVRGLNRLGVKLKL